MQDSWKPGQYERFKDERTQPFFDLAALLEPRPGLRVLDLGCGTGELTRRLHDQLAAARTLGVDTSPAMLAKAAAFASESCTFGQADLATLDDPATWDVVVSNAALHWLPDHEALLPRLFRLLAPGGQIAVQVPYNPAHPAYVTAYELAAEEPWRSALSTDPFRLHALPPERYSALLHALGAAEQHVRLQVYPHALASRGDVVEWVKGTFLTGYEARLGPERFTDFVARYRERLLPRLPDTHPYLFAFCRILLWARLPG